MKTSVLSLILIVSIALLSGCTKEEQKEIIGTWKLKNVSGSIAGVNIDYSNEDVVWKFMSDNTLVIENNIVTTGPEDIYSGRDSGTYSYDLQKSNELYIDNVKRGEITIEDSVLKIDDGVGTDGLLTIFDLQ